MSKIKLPLAFTICGLGMFNQWAAAQDILPTALPNMQLVPSVPTEPLQTMAEEHGFSCLGMRLFTYTNPNFATQAVNSWLREQQMQTKTVAQSPGIIQWKAWNSGNTDLYAVWQSTGENKGNLWMCSGTDSEAQTARQNQQMAQVQQQSQISTAQVAQTQERLQNLETSQESQSHTRFRIPLWAIVALGSGLAGGAAKSIHKNPFSPDE